jgi:hypothetical protein
MQIAMVIWCKFGIYTPLENGKRPFEGFWKIYIFTKKYLKNFFRVETRFSLGMAASFEFHALF